MNDHNYSEEKIIESLAKGRSFNLSTASRGRIHDELAAFADLHTVRIANQMASPLLRSPYFTLRNLSYAFMALLLIISTGAGTTYASEKALPGDTLYPLKINISEPVQAAFISTTKGKATWHAKLAERRLEEATALAVTHKLDENTSKYLAKEFTASVAQSIKEADTLERSGDVEGSTDAKNDLEAKVTAHANILNLVASSTVMASNSMMTPEVTAIANIATQVNLKQVAITSSRKKVENDIVAKSIHKSTPIIAAQKDQVSSSATTTTPVELVHPTTDVPATSTAPVLEEKTVLLLSVQTAHIQLRNASRDAEIKLILNKNKELLQSLVGAIPAANVTATSTLATPTDKKI